MSSHTVKAFFILIVFSKILGIFEKLAFHFAALLFCGSQISPFRPWRGFIYTYSSSFTFQSSKTRHTVAIWTFTFHNKSGFVMVIFKVKFKPAYRPVSWTFWSENSDLLCSFSFYFLQELSNSLPFAHIYCYFKKVEMLESHFCIKLQLEYVMSLESVQKAVDLTTPAKNRRKISLVNLNFQIKRFMILACTLVWNLPSKSPLQSLIFCEM